MPIRTVRVRHRGEPIQPLFAYNSAGSTGIAGGVAEMCGNYGGMFKFRRPTEDNAANCVVIGDVDIPAAKPGLLWEIGTHPMKYDGDDPSVGDYMGSQTDSWYATRSESGVWIVRDVDTTNKFAYVFLGGGGGGSRVVPVKITSGSGENHTGNVYANGKNDALTEYAVTIKVLDIAAGESIPANRWFLASQQNWSGVTYWTIEVARDY